MKSGGKTCSKCGCDMEDEMYEKEEKEMKSGGMACMKCGGKMHKSGGTVSSCMKCGGGKYTFGGKVGWSKKKINSQYASGGMIKRADGSYSQRGLWDNIRANAGSGKKPTKQMLEQEKKIKQEMAVGGAVDHNCPPGYKWDDRIKFCVEATYTNDFASGYKVTDYRPWMLNEIPGANKRSNPIKYYDEGDPAGIKASQMYADSLALYYKTQNEISHYKPTVATLPNYTPIEKGSWTDMFTNTNSKIKPVGQFKSPKSQCNKDGVCIDVYPKPVQPIGFKNKPIVPTMNPKDTIGYKMSQLTNTPNTSNDRKELAKQYDFESKTGRPYSGTIEDNVYLYEEIKKINETKKSLDVPKKTDTTPINKIEQIKVNTESTLSPINTETLKPSLIPTKDIYQKITDMPKGNETETDEEILGKLKGKGIWRGAAGWVPLTDKEKIDFYKRGAEFKDLPEKDVKGPGFHSFGGAIKSYLNGGEVGVPSTNTDQETPLSSGAYNVPEPKYDTSVLSNASPMQMTDNITQGVEQTGYKEIVQSFRKKEVDKSLPNFGYAKQEQMKLNELIRNDISAGNAKMDLLIEDDIIGEKTLGAMRAYEASGQYVRPEGFKDKYLAEYKKQWEEMQATGKAPKGPAPKAVIEQPKKEESKTLIDNIYDYFKPPKKQSVVKDTSTEYTGVTAGGYRYYRDKNGIPVVEIPDDEIPYNSEGKYDSQMADEIEKRKLKKGKNKVIKGSFFPSASDMMTGLQGSVDYAGNALSSFIGNAADFVKNNQNKTTENKTTENKNYTVKSKAASSSAKKIASQNKSGVTVLRKYNASGPSYTKSKIVVKDNATNKTHTVIIPQMFDKAKGKYHTIEIAGKKHKIFLDPNLK